MKNIFILGVLTLTAILAQPADTLAYTAKTGSAVRLSPEYSLFTINYNVEANDKDTFLPIGSFRGSELKDKQALMGYEVVNSDGLRIKDGETAGLVLSKQPVKDNQYFTEAGEKGEFTLVVLYKHEATKKDFGLKLTAFPIIFEKNMRQYYTSLHEHELTSFKTKIMN